MIKNEIIKIGSDKFLFYTFVILLLVQIGLVCWMQYDKEDKTGISNNAYFELIEDIKNINEDEVVDNLNSKIKHLETIRYVMIYAMSGMPLDELEIENAETFLQEYEEGSYLLYTDSVESELSLYKEVYDEYNEVYTYSATIKSILDNTERYMNSSKTDKKAFDYYRALKTNQKYQKFSASEPSYVPAKGIDFYLKYEMTDYLIMAFMMFATVVTVTMESEKGLTLLSKTTRLGGINHGLVKIISLGIVCALVTVLMYIALFLVTKIYYPIFSLNEPIQAVSGYTYCSLEVSIGQFIVINVLMKILFYFSVTCIFYCLCCGFRSSIPVFFISVGIIALLTFLSTVIKPTSHIAWINNFNLLSYRSVVEILRRYTCINVCGLAVDKIGFTIIYLLLICMVCIILGIALYVFREEREKKSFQSIVVNKRKKMHVNMLFHEIYKVFIAQGGVLILIVAVFIAYVTYSPVNRLNYSLEEVMYDYNSDKVQGQYTDKSEAYIASFKEKVEIEIDNRYETATYSEKLIMEAEKMASQLMENYGKYLSHKENSYFINNDGYLALTQAYDDVNQHNAIKMIFTAGVAAILFVTVMSVDYQNGEEKLIHTTVFGGRKYIVYKILIGAVIVIILFAIFWIPELISTIKHYGIEYIDAPAYSLPHLQEVPKWISIKIYIVFCYLIRLLFVCGMLVVSYVTSVKVRSKSASIVIAWIITILPIVLYMSMY